MLSPKALSPKSRRSAQDVEDHFPEVEAFQPEEGCSKLQLILKYALDDDGPAALHRTALIQGLAAAVEEEGNQHNADEVLHEVLMLVGEIAVRGDSASVMAMVGQLPQICRHFQSIPGEHPQAEGLVEKLMSVIEGIITQPADEEVATGCLDAAAGLLSLLPKGGQLQSYLGSGLPAKLAGNQDEEMRIHAAQLLPRIACHFEPEQVLGPLMELLSKLLSDSDLDVRRDAVGGIPQVCSTLPEGARSDLILPAVVKAAADEMWNVRMECASILPRVAELVGQADGPQELRRVCEQLLDDRSKWVKHEARMQLGDFVASPACAQGVSETIAEQLLSILQCGERGESELQEAIQALRHLPAMTSALGAEWMDKIAPGLHQVARSAKVPLKAALAESLHTIAPLCAARSDLQASLGELFVEMLNQDEPAVQVGLVNNIGVLLRALPGNCCRALVDKLPAMAFQKGQDCSKWRTRLTLTEQLSSLAGSNSGGESAAGAVLSVAVDLCSDPVATIRAEAAKQVAQILLQQPRQAGASDAQASASSHSGRILEMAQSKRHIDRQAYADICARLLSELPRSSVDGGIYAEFEPPLIRMAEDPVPVVRSRVAQALAAACASEGAAASSAGTWGALQKMSGDTDTEVRSIAASAVRKLGTSPTREPRS